MSALLLAARGLFTRAAATVGLRWFVALAGAAGAGLCWTGVIAFELPVAARSSLGVASLSVGLWASELLALPVTAILAMLLLFVTGATPTVEQAFEGVASPVFFFLLGSVAIGIAAEYSGLADRLAAWLLARSHGSGRRLLGELLLSLPLQALIIPSAMSRNTVLVPIYERVLGRLGKPRRLGAAVMLTLGVLGPLASSAILSGGTSPVAAEAVIGGFTWTSWFLRLAPPYYALLAIDGLLIWLVTRPERTLEIAEPAEEPHRSHLSAAERRVAAVSAGASLLWALDRFTHWPPAIPALLAMVLLLTPRLGVMSWQGFAARVPWGTCLVLAGAISLADALTRTGAAAWVAHGLFGWVAVPHVAPAMAFAIFLVIAVITLAIPNRAAAITLGIPLATVYAASGGIQPAAAGLVVLFAVDAEAIYPAQTAANLLAYDAGYFTSGELARFNVLTMLAALAVIILVALPWWSFTGLPHMP